MNEKQVREVFDFDLLWHLNNAKSLLEIGGNRESVIDYIAQAKGIAWVANSLGIITADEWDSINGILVHFKYAVIYGGRR